MLLGGLLLHRRQDVPYLSEGLAGGGLGCLYLSLFAAHVLYGLIGPTAAFTSMFAVTLLGTLVAVLSGRLSTAVLAVLGGLLTPVLLRVERPDERNLLAYLLVLDVLVLLVARFRTWPALTQLAWGGSALLLLQTLWGAARGPASAGSAAPSLGAVPRLPGRAAVPGAGDGPSEQADRPDPRGRQRGRLLLGRLLHA